MLSPLVPVFLLATVYWGLGNDLDVTHITSIAGVSNCCRQPRWWAGCLHRRRCACRRVMGGAHCLQRSPGSADTNVSHSLCFGQVLFMWVTSGGEWRHFASSSWMPNAWQLAMLRRSVIALPLLARPSPHALPCRCPPAPCAAAYGSMGLMVKRPGRALRGMGVEQPGLRCALRLSTFLPLITLLPMHSCSPPSLKSGLCTCGSGPTASTHPPPTW